MRRVIVKKGGKREVHNFKVLDVLPEVIYINTSFVIRISKSQRRYFYGIYKKPT